MLQLHLCLQAHCFNMAVELLQVSTGKLEAHEYPNALVAGEPMSVFPLQSGLCSIRRGSLWRKDNKFYRKITRTVMQCTDLVVLIF